MSSTASQMSLIVKNAFSGVDDAVSTMCYCVLCKKNVPIGDLRQICKVWEGPTANKALLANAANSPPCMICRGCALGRQDRYAGRALDDLNSRLCKVCPYTTAWVRQMYSDREEEVPRYVSATRRHMIDSNFHPPGNKEQVICLQSRVAQLKEAVVAAEQDHHRKLEKISHQLVVERRKNAGAAAGSYEEEAEARRQIRASAGDKEALARAPPPETSVAEEEPMGGGDGDITNGELLGEECEECEECEEGEVLPPPAAAVAAAPAAEELEEKGDGPYDAMDDTSVVGAEPLAGTVQAVGAAAVGDEDGDDDEEEDVPLARRAQHAKKLKKGDGSAAARAQPEEKADAARKGGGRKRRAVPAEEEDDPQGLPMPGEDDPLAAEARDYKPPANRVKAFKQWIKDNKTVEEWISMINQEKEKKANTRVENKKKLANYDAIIRERDAAVEREQRERESKQAVVKAAANAAEKTAKDKYQKYVAYFEKTSSMLVHLGVSPEHVTNHLLGKISTEELKTLYKEDTAQQVGETSADGEADASAEDDEYSAWEAAEEAAGESAEDDEEAAEEAAEQAAEDDDYSAWEAVGESSEDDEY